ncbi:MAG: conserved repeat domain protein, partial [Planctomycetaceae bacterium]|nr:conserved repeat domain protein [Planctomycetaceae bacterium]
MSSLELLEERVVPAVYLITGTADGTGTVTPSSTPGIDFNATTLRGAILAANASVGVADTIELPGGTYSLTLTGASEDAAASGDLDITGDLTITGSGNATIDGNNTDRVFQVISGNVTLSALTIEHGLTSGAGGGVLVSGGQLTLLGALITANSSQGLNTTVPFATGGSGLGGGLAVTGGSASLRNSTVSNNTAIGGQGIVGGEGFGGPADGGGVYASGTVTIENSTIAFNSATGGQGAFSTGSAAGGGIYLTAGTPSPVIGSTIIAENTAVSGPDAAASGGATFTSEGFNLIGVAAGTEGFTSPTDLVGSSGSPLDPQFSSNVPANNGGVTNTFGLEIDSPAIDAGKNLASLVNDQRGTGFVRTFEQSGVTNATGGDGTDIGAYESSDLHLVVDITVDQDDGNYLAGNLSLREAIYLSNVNSGADTISFAPAVQGQMFDISIGQASPNSIPGDTGISAFLIDGDLT